jgi:predicted 3-demethylubiquinone-9 3-methyltransferase (glyoxalase superfamily)
VSPVVSSLFMFEGRAEEAMTFYVSLFDDAEVEHVVRFGPGEPGPEGSILLADFRLGGQSFQCMDSYIRHAFTFTPATSVSVELPTEAEVDAVFARLAEDGQVLMPVAAYPFSPHFGWLTDRFGVSWQVQVARSPG